jgi:hypothetical protein
MPKPHLEPPLRVGEVAAEFALRRARAVVFASAAARLVARATAVREVLPAESACGAEDVTPVVVEPVLGYRRFSGRRLPCRTRTTVTSAALGSTL